MAGEREEFASMLHAAADQIEACADDADYGSLRVVSNALRQAAGWTRSAPEPHVAQAGPAGAAPGGEVEGLVEKAQSALPEWPHVQISVSGESGATDLVSAYILANPPGALLALVAEHAEDIAQRDAAISTLAGENEVLKIMCLGRVRASDHIQAIEERDAALAALAEAREEVAKLRGAISWLEPPFVDASTPEAEIRNLSESYGTFSASPFALWERMRIYSVSTGRGCTRWRQTCRNQERHSWPTTPPSTPKPTS